ncbi:MAG: bacillithiol biosynthesis deacetylase BshB1 [Bradyrhizobiaceae bacterium]|nr:bacillithiol biosynthesis deacetylase BshB1 [Bradyrhizobiaceae bacterium]
MSADVLVLSAHPDDAELCAGGTIAKLTSEGKRVVLVDCTAGELGTRGTPQIRAEEAAHAAHILGVHERIILSMPDGNITDSQENRLEVIRMYRRYKPSLILTSPSIERHPDHEAVHRLARAAAFLSGLRHITTTDDGVQQETHRPKRIMCYQHQHDLPDGADLLVDVSSTWDLKIAAILAFASQFHAPNTYTSDEPETLISRPAFLAEVEGRARYYGSRFGVTFAEAFKSVEPLAVDSLSVFL